MRGQPLIVRAKVSPRRLPDTPRAVCPACGGPITTPEFLETRGSGFAEELARIGNAINAAASFVLAWVDLHEQMRPAAPAGRGRSSTVRPR
jgi:hypothetical protein